MSKKNSKSKTTTIQVKSDLKDKLDLLKILLGKEDLNALLSEITEFYTENSDVKIDKKIEKFFNALSK